MNAGKGIVYERRVARRRGARARRSVRVNPIPNPDPNPIGPVRAHSHPVFFRSGDLRRHSCFGPRMFSGDVTSLSKLLSELSIGVSILYI